MPSDEDTSAKTINVKVELAGPDWQLQTTMSVPTEPISAERNAAAVFFVCRRRDEHSGQWRRAKRRKDFLQERMRRVLPAAGADLRDRGALDWGAGRSFTYSKTNCRFGTASPRPGADLPKPVYWKSCSIAKVGPKVRDGPLRCPIFVWGLPAHFSKTKPARFIQTVP